MLQGKQGGLRRQTSTRANIRTHVRLYSHHPGLRSARRTWLALEWPPHLQRTQCCSPFLPGSSPKASPLPILSPTHHFSGQRASTGHPHVHQLPPASTRYLLLATLLLTQVTLPRTRYHALSCTRQHERQARACRRLRSAQVRLPRTTCPVKASLHPRWLTCPARR